jgi:hypothetical protein
MYPHNYPCSTPARNAPPCGDGVAIYPTSRVAGLVILAVMYVIEHTEHDVSVYRVRANVGNSPPQ